MVIATRGGRLESLSARCPRHSLLSARRVGTFASPEPTLSATVGSHRAGPPASTAA